MSGSFGHPAGRAGRYRMIGTNLQSPRSARTVGCVSAGQESVVSSSGRSRCHFSSEHVQPHVWVTPFRECKEKERRLCTWVLSSVRMRAPLPLLSALCVPDRSLKAQAPSSPPQSSRVRTPVLARLHCTFHWSITPQRSTPRSKAQAPFPCSQKLLLIAVGP